MASTEIAVQSGELFVSQAQTPAASLSVISIIDKIVSTPGLDAERVGVLERLLAMQREIVADQRKAEFNDALARVQARMPQIDQNGRIDYGGGKKPISYAELEDIDAIIRPIYSEEGFSVTWNSESIMDGKGLKIIGNFKHRSGHDEPLSVPLPIDSSGGKTGIQGSVSSVSYGKRTLLKMFFNLIERGTDKDGADLKTISQSQADDLQSALEEVGANKAAFLEFAGVKKLGDILAKDYQKALNAIDAKRRGKK